LLAVIVRSWFVFTVVLCCILTLVSVAYASKAEPTDVLFALEKSTNANRVIYDVTHDSSAPVRARWEMLAEDGRYEALNSFERNRIYGVKVLNREPGSVSFTFKALPEYPIFVTEIAGEPAAQIQLLGKTRRIRRIFLKLSEGIFPKIKAIEFSLDGSEQVSLLPKREGEWREVETTAMEAR